LIILCLAALLPFLFNLTIFLNLLLLLLITFRWRCSGDPLQELLRLPVCVGLQYGLSQLPTRTTSGNPGTEGPRSVLCYIRPPGGGPEHSGWGDSGEAVHFLHE
jgi:hypothetical protein